MPGSPGQYDAQQLAMLGSYSIQRGDFATAVQAFRKVLEQEPESATAYHNLGVAYYKEGHFDKAKAALRRAAELNPAGPGPRFVLGLIARDERDYPAAVTAFTEAIERYHGDSRAYANRGTVYFYLEEHDRAIADLRQAIAINPGDVDATYNLAVVYASCARWDEAQECLVRCVSKEPHRAQKYIAVLTDIGRAQVYEVLYRRGHRIKNALGSLGARLRHLVGKLEGVQDTAEWRERLERIVAEHDRLFAQMATYLMTMRSDERSVEEVNLNVLLGDLVESFRGRVGTAIEFVTRFDSAVPAILADQAALTEALGNVVLNAVEAIEETGTVTCATSVREPTAEQPRAIVVTISDTGTGLAPEQAGHVFKVGFTTKKTGSGIGLSVAKRSVERHGGTIALDSVENEGTTVTITIPCRVDTAKLRQPIPIRSSLIEDPSQLIATEGASPGAPR
jgi:signal transduction histidine kinase